MDKAEESPRSCGWDCCLHPCSGEGCVSRDWRTVPPPGKPSEQQTCVLECAWGPALWCSPNQAASALFPELAWSELGLGALAVEHCSRREWWSVAPALVQPHTGGEQLGTHLVSREGSNPSALGAACKTHPSETGGRRDFEG